MSTQSNWKTSADIKAIEQALVKMLTYCVQNNIDKIALPKIGSGLGDLNWLDAKQLINNIAVNYPNIDLFVVENYNES